MAFQELVRLEKDLEQVSDKRQAYLRAKDNVIKKKLKSITRENERKKMLLAEQTYRKERLERKKNADRDRSRNVDVKLLEEEVSRYHSAFEELKKLTGANDVNEIIQKYLIQEETR